MPLCFAPLTDCRTSPTNFPTFWNKVANICPMSFVHYATHLHIVEKWPQGGKCFGANAHFPPQMFDWSEIRFWSTKLQFKYFSFYTSLTGKIDFANLQIHVPWLSCWEEPVLKISAVILRAFGGDVFKYSPCAFFFCLFMRVTRKTTKKVCFRGPVRKKYYFYSIIREQTFPIINGWAKKVSFCLCSI